MITDTEIRLKGLEGLTASLGDIEVERFNIFLGCRFKPLLQAYALVVVAYAER